MSYFLITKKPSLGRVAVFLCRFTNRDCDLERPNMRRVDRSCPIGREFQFTITEGAPQQKKRLCFLEDCGMIGEYQGDAPCFLVCGGAGPVQQAAVNHVRRGTEQH